MNDGLRPDPKVKQAFWRSGFHSTMEARLKNVFFRINGLVMGLPVESWEYAKMRHDRWLLWLFANEERQRHKLEIEELQQNLDF